jgi:hypothetical protein
MAARVAQIARLQGGNGVMKLSNTKIFSMLATGLALCALPSKSFAAISVYPGSICKPTWSSDYTVDSIGWSNFNTYGGHVLMAGKNNLRVTCPIPRNNATNSNGVRQIFVSVDIGQDRRKVTCTLSNADAYGDTLHSATTWTTWQQPYARSQTLWWRIDQSSQYTAYTVTCDMEAGNAEIQRIIVDEF